MAPMKVTPSRLVGAIPPKRSEACRAVPWWPSGREAGLDTERGGDAAGEYVSAEIHDLTQQAHGARAVRLEKSGPAQQLSFEIDLLAGLESSAGLYGGSDEHLGQRPGGDRGRGLGSLRRADVHDVVFVRCSAHIAHIGEGAFPLVSANG